MSTKEPRTLIVGGAGKTGRRVARRLETRGLPVRFASRSSAPAFDWEEPATWQAALRDVDRVYLTYYPDLAAPEAGERIRRFSRLAVETGARRIVLLSGRGEEEVLPSEQGVAESGADFTILRAAWFCQNFSEGQMLEDVLRGEVAFPAGSVAEPFIDAEDIAEVAVAALTDDRHRGKTYELSGPRLLTFADAAAEIAEVSGRTVRYVPISFEEYAAALAEHVPPAYVTFMTDLFRHVLDGHNAYLSDGVERALGRKPRDFRDFAREAAAAAAWPR